MKRHMECALALLAFLSFVAPAARSQDLLWDNNYGGEYHEFGQACQQTDNGDLFVLGSTFSYGSGDFDIYLVRLDSLGNRLSSATFGGETTDYGYDMAKTADGGLIIVGSTKSYGAGENDVYLIKLDANGDMMWSKTFGGMNDDVGKSVRQTNDMGYIICGGTFSSGAGYEDVLIIKTDAAGNLSWQRTFGGTGGESGSAIRQTPDGGYVTIGSTGSFGDGYSSIYVIRTDHSGSLVWSSTYGGLKADYGYSIEVTQDGGLVMVGATASLGAGSSDAYMIKTDPDGYMEWERTYGGANDDRAYSVLETSAGGFVLAGNSLSFSSSFDVYAVMTNPVGDMVWSQDYGGSESDYCQKVLKGIDGNLVLVGKSFSYTSGGSDVYVLKLQSDQATNVFDPIHDMLPSDFQLAQNYPNPFNMSTVIEFSLTRRSPVILSVYNILGQTVKQWSDESLPAGTYRFEWDGKNESGGDIASGVYLYNLRAGTANQTKKMVLLK